jgi:hypothetical protein
MNPDPFHKDALLAYYPRAVLGSRSIEVTSEAIQCARRSGKLRQS